MAVLSPALGFVPRHVAVIMDGNRRWARARGLSTEEGYRRGVDALRGLVRTAAKRGVEVVTVYGFSTENWRRERSEVAFLMQLCAIAAKTEMFGLLRENVRVRVVGDVSAFPAATRAALRRLERTTAKNTGIALHLALNYSGRAEIVSAVRRIASAAAAGEIAPEDIGEETIGAHLFTHGVPDPDLLVRTGGEQRISNFLLYQSAYAEFWTTPVLWPDFDEGCFDEALEEFARRQRRFGF
ncbi:MAG: di-trans,poly-cis-decaprenylcistransferase [Candidatus Eremiobacteraeota bacterium]|nr:di-trans,poly-cis-decaprenylcistransferase [Candidatus Eremiobacteraeota bacterium]